MSPASASSTAHTPDRLVSNQDYPLFSKKITLLSGENRSRGAVLGKVTASGKYKLSAAAAGDGSETPDAILTVDTDASAADVETVAYFRGQFDDGEITLGAGHTVASVFEGLRAKGIFLETVEDVE